MCKYTNKDNAPDDDDNDTQGEDKKPKRCKHGNYWGKKKLLDIKLVVILKEKKVSEIATYLGGEEHKQCFELIKNLLMSKVENLKEKKADTSVRLMLEMFEKDKNPNANESGYSENVPSCLLGYFPYGPISRR
jgi:hypothetical protein